MNPYYASASSLTSKDTPIATPPNQATNQNFASTAPPTKHPHSPKSKQPNSNQPQISTKICHHNHHQISSSHSFSTRKKLVLYPTYKSQAENNKNEGQKVRTEGNQRKKSYAEIVRQSQCHQYKNDNSTNSPPKQNPIYIRRIKRTPTNLGIILK